MILKRNSGQATLEACLSIGLFLGLLGGSSQLFWAQWTRFQCAHTLFEITRSALNEKVLPHSQSSGRIRVQLSLENEKVKGTAQCGKIKETLTLRRIRKTRNTLN